jgi:hypothetical protein
VAWRREARDSGWPPVQRTCWNRTYRRAVVQSPPPEQISTRLWRVGGGPGTAPSTPCPPSATPMSICCAASAHTRSSTAPPTRGARRSRRTFATSVYNRPSCPSCC